MPIKKLIICPNFDNNDTIHNIDHDLYYRTLPNHPKEPPKIVIGEPCMVNPNSTEAARPQPKFTCSKLTIETLDQGVKYIQS